MASPPTHTPTDHPDTTTGPLAGGWTALITTTGAMAALIAIGGMILSFRAVSTEMTPAFGARWAWLVPIVVDLTVLVFSGVDLVLNRLNMSHPLARWTVYGATGGTVYLNYSAGGTPAGRIAHVLMPAIWVMFIELMRHVVRRLTNLATGTHRDPIPTMRWVLAPWPTLKLWRRMVLWQITSYSGALAAERVRLTRVAAMREQHGLLWRWRVSALERLSISLAEHSDTGRSAVHGAARPALERPAPVEGHSALSGALEQTIAERSGLAVERSVERSAPSAPLHTPQSNPRSTTAHSTAQSAQHPNPRAARSAPERRTQSAPGNAGALERLTAAETLALNDLAEQWAPAIPSQGAIRNALPLVNGKRCGASRAIGIQSALKARAEHPDDPDPLADALDAELAATAP